MRGTKVVLRVTNFLLPKPSSQRRQSSARDQPQSHPLVPSPTVAITGADACRRAIARHNSSQDRVQQNSHADAAAALRDSQDSPLRALRLRHGLSPQ